jgi:PASTA domain
MIASAALLSACAAQEDDIDEDIAETPLAIVGGQPDTQFLNVAAVASDDTYCAGTVIAPYYVVTPKACVGDNMTVTIPEVGTSIVRDIEVPPIALDRLAILRLHRPFAHAGAVLPHAGPIWTFDGPCLFVGYGSDHVRKSVPVTLRINFGTGDHSPSNYIFPQAVVEEYGDIGGPVVCDGVIKAVLYTTHQTGTGTGVDQLHNYALRHDHTPQYMSSVAQPLTMNAQGQGQVLHSDTGGVVIDVGQTLGPPSAGSWRFATGDFDFDLHDEVLWQNAVTGQVFHQKFKFGMPLGTTFIGGQAASNVVQGIGDFDGDEYDDVLWRNSDGLLTMWLGGRPEGSVYVGYDHRNRNVPIDLAWKVKAVADFDGDGRADILWRHDSGPVSFWYMYGNDRLWDRTVTVGDPSAWTLAGVGRLDQNARAELVWHHTNGTVVMWVDGEPNVQTFTAPRDASWRLGGIGDMDGDGRGEIVWDKSDGQVRIWRVLGSQVLMDLNPVLFPNRGLGLPVVGMLRQQRQRSTVLPVTRTVPAVGGKSESAARRLLEPLAFSVVTEYEQDPNCNNIGRVMEQSPPAGADAPYRSTVTIRVGLAPPFCP